MSASHKGRYCQNANCSHLTDPENKNKVPKRLVDPDWHPYCLRCLPLDHDPDNCSICVAFSNKTRDAREYAVKQFKESGSWPSQVNSKSLDKKKVQQRASSREKSQSIERKRKSKSKSHSSSKGKHTDLSAVMTAASEMYEKRGRELSSQFAPPKKVTPVIPATPPTPKEEEVESDSDLQEDMDQESASIAEKAMTAVDQNKSDSDVVIEEEEEYKEDPVPKPPLHPIVDKPVLPKTFPDKYVPKIPVERYVEPANDPNWKLAGVSIENMAEDPRNKSKSKSKSGSESKEKSRSASKQLSLHRSRSRSPSRSRRSRSRSYGSRSNHSKRSHKRRRRRYSYSSSPETMDPQAMMISVMSKIGDQMSKSLTTSMSLALAPLLRATQSVAPVEVSAIPITQAEEDVVPSGPLNDPPPPASTTHHSSHEVEGSSDSDSGSESSDKKSGERKSNRKRWIGKIFDFLDGVDKPEQPVPDKAVKNWWGRSDQKSTSHDFPTLPIHRAVGVQLEGRVRSHFLQVSSGKGSKKKFNPSKAYNGIYRAPDDTHFALTKSHAVSAELLAEMKSEAVGVSEVGVKARLKKNTTAGTAEAVCLTRQERASTAFRMINSLQLNQQATDTVFQRLTDRITEFNKTSILNDMVSSLKATDPLRRELIALLSIVSDTENCVSLLRDQTQDSRQTNADLFNLHSNDYVEAVSDRRKLWLDNSRVRGNVQREMFQLPIDTFSLTERSSGDLLGAQASIRLGQELNARKSEQAFKIAQATVHSIAKMAPISKVTKPNAKSNQPKKKNNNTNSAETTTTDTPFRGNATQSRGGRGGGGGSQKKPYKGNKKFTKKGSN